jgi:protein TonB
VARSARAFGSVWRVAPAWLRPCAIGVVALLHAAVLFGVPWQQPNELAVPVTLQVEVVAGGEPAHGEQEVDAKQSDGQVGEVKPLETPPVEVKTATAESLPQATAETKPVEETAPSLPPPEAKPSVSAEPAPADSDHGSALAMIAPVVQSEERQPDAPPSSIAPPPKQQTAPAHDLQRQEKPKEKKSEKHNERADEEKHAAAAAPVRLASRAGTESGRGETGAASGTSSAADYGRLVYAEISRHSHYPQQASPATGTVVLSFTVGASGRVTSSSIVQSSGNGLLDGAARQTLSALSLPPPPGGRYSNSVPVHLRPN